MFKKFLILLISFSLFTIPMVTYAAPTDSSDKEELTDFESQIPDEVRHAKGKQDEALNYFKNIIDSFPQNEIGLPIFPDEYGGAYIDDMGNLVLQLTDTSDEMKNKYIELCGSDYKLIIKKVPNSLNKLSSYGHYADDMMRKGYNVVASGIDEMTNSFNIYVSTHSRECLFSLKGNPDLPVNIFFQATPDSYTSLVLVLLYFVTEVL